MAKAIVVFGATGELVARALIARGRRPVLAARSVERLVPLARELGGLQTCIADISRPKTVRALVERGDVLISTVGPFALWGEPAVDATIEAGATYLDSSGEPGFIRRVFEHHHHAAKAADCALMTAFGFDWVPGNLAAALALREAGSEAARVEVGYFVRGTRISGGTRASMIGALLEPSYAFRGGQLIAERTTARVRTFEVAFGTTRAAASVGGSEHLSLPAVFPELHDVGVFLGLPRAKRISSVSAGLDAVMRLPRARSLARSLAARLARSSPPGPDASARNRSTSTIVAETFSSSGKPLARVQLNGPDPYSFTAEFLAWAATVASDQGVRGVGALGPVSAFGIDLLEAGAREAGLHQP